MAGAVRTVNGAAGDAPVGARRTVSTTAAQRIHRGHQPRYFETRELELMAESHRGARCLPPIHLSLTITVRAVDANMIPARAGEEGLDLSISSTERDNREVTERVSH